MSLDFADRATPLDEVIDTSRPAIENDDGSFSTERTITVERDGRYYLVPSVVDGAELSEEDAVLAWHDGKNPEVGGFADVDSAERAAKRRSELIAQKRGAKGSSLDFSKFGTLAEDSPEEATLTTAMSRGIGQVFRAGSGLAASANARMLESLDRIDRGERVAEVDDPVGYQHMDPEQRRKARADLERSLGTAVAKTAQHAQTIESIPEAPAVKRLKEARDFGEVWDAFVSDPVRVVGHLGAESLPGSAIGMAGAAVAGPIGGAPLAAAAMGGGSYAIEYGSGILEGLTKAGVDVRNPAALRAAVANPAIMVQVRRAAATKAGVVGALDAASGGAAGRTLAPASMAARPLAREATNVAVQAPVQGALGAAGEVAGSLAAGDDVSPGAVAAEFLGEFAGTPAEVASMAASRPALRTAAPAPTQSEVPPAPAPPARDPNVVDFERPDVAGMRADNLEVAPGAAPAPDPNAIDFTPADPLAPAAAVESAEAAQAARQADAARAVDFEARGRGDGLELAPGAAPPAGNEIDIHAFLRERALERARSMELAPGRVEAEMQAAQQAVETAPDMRSAAARAGELTETTGVEHRARNVGGQWAVVKVGDTTPEVPDARTVEDPAPADTGTPGAAPALASGVQLPPATEDQGSARPKAPAEEVATVDAAAHQAATSPQNDRPEPTPAQKEAGNYAKGHERVAGMDISIENPAGSKRRPEWPELKSHYGYIRRSEGADGDQVDVFLKPGTPTDYAGPVFVVDQVKRNHHFDEHKVVLGAANMDEARALYAENYTPDFKVGPITELTMAQFRAWVRDGKLTKRPVNTLSPKEWKQIRSAGRTPQELAVAGLRDEIGWAERGGHMIRAVDTGKEKAEVVGRTQWLGKSDFWPGRPEPRITETAARKAFAKLEAGEALSVPEQRFVDYATEWLSRKEAEAAAPKERAFERRSDDAQRKRVADMAPEEMRKALLTDTLMGIGNRRGWEEVRQDAPKPVISAIDVDSLGWLNDNMGHQAADEVLRAIGEAFHSAGVTAYRTGGDEVMAQFDTDEQARDAIERVKAILDEAEVTAIKGDQRITKKGVGLSYGLGPTEKAADDDLYQDKRWREDAGVRPPKKAEPPGVHRGPAVQAGPDRGSPAEGVGPKFARKGFKQPATPQLDLTGETEGEIRAREALEKKAAEEKAKRDKAPGPSGFTLTGSDRAVDVAEAHGQKPLFARAGATTSEAFKRWFGKSKVANKDGSPRRVFHGTGEDFTVFDGYEITGWFSEQPGLAEDHGEARSDMDEETGGGLNVMPVYLSIQNPVDFGPLFDINEEYARGDIYRQVGLDVPADLDAGYVGPGWEIINHYQFEDAARAKGYDGIKVKQGDVQTWAAFDSRQIKSAVGNSGTFDASNPDIRFARGAASRLPTTTVGDFATGKPVTFDFMRRTESAPRPSRDGEDRFAQKIEPAGRYMGEKPGSAIEMKGVEFGTKTFSYPLVLEYGKGLYTDSTNWKQQLSRAYGGKTGKALSRALLADGYDGIVTVGETRGKKHTSEIVDLTVVGKPAERDLIVQHNITAENILHAQRMGGMAVPSLAITKVGSPLEGFGEITLIGPPQMADPRGYANTRVFGADIYSPRYPQVSYKLDKAALRRLNDKLKPHGGREIYGSDVDSVRDLTQVDAFRKYAEAKLGKDWRTKDMDELAAETLREAGAVEKLFQGFDYNGNRRYAPHTLERVVRILKKEIRGGEGFNYGVGSARAHFAPQFRSLKAIKDAKNRLVPKEKMEAVKKEVDAEFWELAKELQPYYKYEVKLGFGDTVVSVLTDAARGGLHRELKEYGFEDVPSDVVNQVYDFMAKLRDLPTEYFEGKILREVDLAEFTAAVVPSDVNPKARKALEDRGVRVFEYDKNDPASRAKAIAEAATERDALFRRGDAPRGMKVAAVRTALTKAIARSKAPIRVVQSVKDLPFEAPADAKGVYFEGTIWAVADNLADPLDAEITIARHEVTHAGTDILFGGDLASREQALRELQGKNAKLREMASAWRTQYGQEWKEQLIAQGKSPEMAQRIMLADSMEEGLAYYSQEVGEIAGWKPFVAAMQRGLRRLGLKRLADWLESATQAEVLDFLREVREIVPGLPPRLPWHPARLRQVLDREDRDRRGRPSLRLGPLLRGPERSGAALQEQPFAPSDHRDRRRADRQQQYEVVVPQGVARQDGARPPHQPAHDRGNRERRREDGGTAGVRIAARRWTLERCRAHARA
jgi:GGDEF domain-containing protein